MAQKLSDDFDKRDAQASKSVKTVRVKADALVNQNGSKWIQSNLEHRTRRYPPRIERPLAEPEPQKWTVATLG